MLNTDNYLNGMQSRAHLLDILSNEVFMTFDGSFMAIMFPDDDD